ncbi:hypothetical protein [Niallia sp. 03190]|uniref:hypothetical protein n=1 Tax=Niallia sp. 03190 TaxID=3458061 RepID=UPI0040450D65
MSIRSTPLSHMTNFLLWRRFSNDYLTISIRKYDVFYTYTVVIRSEKGKKLGLLEDK